MSPGRVCLGVGGRELGPEKQGKAPSLMEVQSRKPLYPEAVCGRLHPATTVVIGDWLQSSAAESRITWQRILSKGVSPGGWPLGMPMRNFLIGLIEL